MNYSGMNKINELFVFFHDLVYYLTKLYIIPKIILNDTMYIIILITSIIIGFSCNIRFIRPIIELKKMVHMGKLDKLPIIIAQTAHALETKKEKCLDLGFTDYITKPFSLQSIDELLNKYSKK